jgi:hypothetical protein
MQLSTPFRKFKIFPDNWLGWEVRIWRWWLPIYLPKTNTFITKEDALQYIKDRYFNEEL